MTRKYRIVYLRFHVRLFVKRRMVWCFARGNVFCVANLTEHTVKVEIYKKLKGLISMRITFLIDSKTRDFRTEFFIPRAKKARARRYNVYSSLRFTERGIERKRERVTSVRGTHPVINSIMFALFDAFGSMSPVPLFPADSLAAALI